MKEPEAPPPFLSLATGPARLCCLQEDVALAPSPQKSPSGVKEPSRLLEARAAAYPEGRFLGPPS